MLYSNQSPFSVRIALNRTFVPRNFFNTCQRVIRALTCTSVSKQKFRESREKLAKISIPGKIANHPKFLDLVTRNVGLNPDIQISAGLFITAKEQPSQNRQNLSTRVNNKTLARQETFEQLSRKMSRKHKVAAYLDDSSLR